MNITAWCGHCGDSFRLLQVVEEGAGGSCPRCGFVFAPGYRTVVVSAIRRLSAAADALEEARMQLHEVAPGLHVDGRRLATDLDLETR